MDPRVRLALNIVEESKGTPRFDLNVICKMLGLTDAYLRRLFHREVGRTFGEHLRRVRMSRADELLKRTSLPIKQIAVECGYGDICNFYRDFKLVHGVTPRQSRLQGMAMTPTIPYRSERPFIDRTA